MADIENICYPLHIVIYSFSSLGQYFFTAISLLILAVKMVLGTGALLFIHRTRDL